MAQEQLNLFEELNENYVINKPIRLIEFFAGIGAQAKALEVLGVPFETWKTCEWAKDSIKAYRQIHHKHEHRDFDLTKEELIEKVKGISANYNEPMTIEQLNRLSIEELRDIHECNLINHNLIDISNVKGQDLEIKETNKYEYILTYSFPCQDLSLAGKQAGMEQGSETRSSLLWQVGRILSECEEKPQILLMENVPEIVSTNNRANFYKWIEQLNDLGYQSFWKILNGKDYLIPQNRRRCFMVSILGDNHYKFPLKMKAKYKLKDFLDKVVEEKYYLSDSKLEAISNWKAQQDPLKDIDKEKQICPTLTARGAGEEHSGMVLINENVITVGNYTPSKHNASRIVDTKGLAPTVMENHGTITAIVEEDTLKKELCNQLIEEGKVKEGDVVKHSFTKQILSGNKKCVEKSNEMIAIPTRGDCIGVVVKDEPIGCEIRTDEGIRTFKGNLMGTLRTTDCCGDKRIIERTLFTDNQAKMIDQNGNIRRYINSDVTDEFKEGQVADISFPNGYNKGKRTNDNCPAINTTTTDSSFITKITQTPLRIRKLTPCECFKLMGFEVQDYENCAEIQSGSKIYHEAGDSIVTTCIMALLGTMLPIDYEQKIKNYVRGLTE